MITIDELKAKLGGMKTAVDDLRDALSIEASEKRLAELEHQMTMPGFYDDQARSQKIIGEMGEVKNKLERFGKLATQYEEAETLLEMIEEENDPALAAEGEEAVEGVEKSIDELQLMTMLNGEYDHNNAILTFHAGTGGTEAQDWAEMLYRMYTRWAEAHGYSVEVLDVLDGDEAGIKSASMMVKGANAYGMLKSEHGVHRLVRISISAQSWASVPPVPAWKVRMALLWSYSPFSIVISCSSSMDFSTPSTASSPSAARAGSFSSSIISSRVSASSYWVFSLPKRSSLFFTSPISLMIFWLRAWSS